MVYRNERIAGAIPYVERRRRTRRPPGGASRRLIAIWLELMHELSIALSIVEIAAEEAERHRAARVEVVHLRLGALSGVVKDALLFSWDLACADTPLAGSRLEVEEIPIKIWCAACQSERTLDAELDFRCPRCGSAAEVRSGRELELSALEIQEGPV